MTEMAEFFNILIYGSGSLLFLLIFLGIGFLIGRKVSYFNIVAMVACLFQAYNYSIQIPNDAFIWHIIMLLVCMCLFLYQFADMARD